MNIKEIEEVINKEAVYNTIHQNKNVTVCMFDLTGSTNMKIKKGHDYGIAAAKVHNKIDPGSGDRRHRDPRSPHRPPRALHPTHQRFGHGPHPTGRPRHQALSGREHGRGGARAAPGQTDL